MLEPLHRTCMPIFRSNNQLSREEQRGGVADRKNPDHSEIRKGRATTQYNPKRIQFFGRDPLPLALIRHWFKSYDRKRKKGY